MPAEYGLLTISVLVAKELKNMEWIGKNDVYATLKLTGGTAGRDVTVRTRTLPNAGATAVWSGEVHDFQVVPRAGLAMEVEVLDQDAKKSQSIGKTALALDSVFKRAAGHRTEKFYDIFGSGGKIHGQIKLGVSWTPPGAAAPAPAPAAAPVLLAAPVPAPAAPSAPPAAAMAQPAAMPQPAPAADDDRRWYYVDPAGATQGPHTAVEMRGWASYFAPTVMVMAPGETAWKPFSSFPQIGGSKPAAPQPVAAARPTLLQVVCPQGVGPGATIHTRTPSGQTLAVQIPAGVFPGMAFNIQCP